MEEEPDNVEMRLLSCMLMYKGGAETGAKATTLVTCYMTDFLSFWVRGGIEQGCLFVSRVIVERIAPGNHLTVSADNDGELAMKELFSDYVCHVYVMDDGLSIACVTTKNYPARAAFGMMFEVINKFRELKPDWIKLVGRKKDKKIAFPFMVNKCKQHHHPQENDKILKINAEVDKVKGIMQKNIEDILARGENLDRLIENTQDLEEGSKIFLKGSKETNSCWKYMCALM